MMSSILGSTVVLVLARARYWYADSLHLPYNFIADHAVDASAFRMVSSMSL